MLLTNLLCKILKQIGCVVTQTGCGWVTKANDRLKLVWLLVLYSYPLNTVSPLSCHCETVSEALGLVLVQ